MAANWKGALQPMRVTDEEAKLDGYQGEGWYAVDDAGALIAGPDSSERGCIDTIEQLTGKRYEPLPTPPAA